MSVFVVGYSGITKGLRGTKGVQSTYELCLDYDSKRYKALFLQGCYGIYHIYWNKFNRVPSIKITQVEETRKGFHVFGLFQDYGIMANFNKTCRFLNDFQFHRIYILMLQNALRSDSTRSLFDFRRAMMNEKSFNLMFSYKNGYVTRFKPLHVLELNKGIRKIEKLYENDKHEHL